MAQEVRIAGATYQSVPSISVPDSNNTYHSFMDTSDANATAGDILSGKTAYVNGAKITGTATGGGGSVTQDQDGFIVLPPDGGGSPSVGGLEYETGTFAPASNISRPTIYFNGNHSTPPIAIIMEDTGSFPNTTYTNVTFQYIDWYRLNGVGNYSSGTNLIYSYPSYSYIGTGTSTLNGSSACTGSNSDSTTDTSATNSRYWAKPDCFMPSSNSTSRYWRSGRSYKWLAVWAPTT